MTGIGVPTVPHWNFPDIGSGLFVSRTTPGRRRGEQRDASRVGCLFEPWLPQSADRFLTATTRIVTAWLAANSVAPPALPGLIRDIHRALTGLESDRAREESEQVRLAKPQPGPRAAVEPRKSVFADHLICLEDGKHVTMLKRHLRTAHGLTPELYRAKWSLPPTYPMVAPNYAKVRSGLAKEAGLGRTGRPRK